MTQRLRPTINASTTSAALIALSLALPFAQGLPAFAQPAVPGLNPEQTPKGHAVPLDINKPTAISPEAPTPVDDGPTYRVSRFELRYRTEHPDHPSLQWIGETRVRLGVAPTGYVSFREGLPSVVVRVADVMEGASTTFHSSGVVAVTQAIVSEFTARGISGVGVEIDPTDIDGNWQDVRGAERSTLRLIIWTGRAARINTLAIGPRFERPDDARDQVAARYDHPNRVHRRIRAQSPVQSGDLLRADLMDAFVARLNRHPGRNVVAQQSPLEGPEDPQAAEVTYRVYEAKPWSAYAQINNTGTKQTNEWRQQFGFVHNQATSHDDVLRLDYVTAGFEDTNAFSGSYEFPILSDRIRARLYASHSEFSASQVGLANETFGGQTTQGGVDVTGLVYQRHNWFADVVGGVRWQRVSVTDTLMGSDAEADFVIPSIGARVERSTLARTTRGGVSVETNLAAVDQITLDQLGRFDTDDTWTVFKYDFSNSAHLGPTWGLGESLAHEGGVRVRGQQALGARLIPNEQDVIGGAYTVRGYPESASAGDSSMVVSLEYKYHVPRGFAVGEPGTIFGRPARTAKWLGNDFRYAPQEPYGMTDWDLVLTAFYDIGKTTKNDKLLGESDGTLSSVGLGAEFSIRSNMSLRLDWGVALDDLSSGGTDVSAGDSRLHVMFTVMY
jgi:hemolysin activation/secretion protein